MEAPPSPLSSRPELRRSVVERSAVQRTFPGNVLNLLCKRRTERAGAAPLGSVKNQRLSVSVTDRQRVASCSRRSRRMRLACISAKARGHPAYWRRWHWRQRTGYCKSNRRSKSFIRKRDRRKLEEEHSGQVTGIHRLPSQEAIIYPARAESYFSTVAGLSRRSARRS
jgi:hypothetical protein